MAAGAALALAAVGCGPRARAFNGVELPTLTSSQVVNLAQCPTRKCLTVVVAPWCGYCRASTGLIVQFRRFLTGKGITTRVVVGQDRPEPVRAYAADFGPDTLLDPHGMVSVPGVPQFIATDSGGRVLKAQGGVPPGLEPPFSDDLLAQLGKLYGVL